MTTLEQLSGESGLIANVWVELIAFDVTANDLGVAAYLADLPELPSRLSLLLYSLEFLHSHRTEDSTPLPVECTSYGARSWSVRGLRQDWTQADLRRLVRLLRAAGIEIFFALFDLCAFEVNQQRQISQFSQDHPELTVVDARGRRRDGMINPLRSLANQTPYVEVILDRVAAVMAYYSFSGWHIADGLSSTRLALWDGDFGVDYVRLFAAQFPGALDPSLLIDDSEAQVAARATAVWRQARSQWISYHCQRWSQLWSAAAKVVDRFGGTVIMNNAWTRDPFEAAYRYGADYSQVEPCGIASMVIEAPAAAVELLNRPECPPLDGIFAATLLTRAHVGNLTALIGVHDVYEGWDVLGHAPVMLQRDLWVLTAAQIATATGWRRCIEGVLWCLADGVSAERWRWLRQQVEHCGPVENAGEATTTLLYDPTVLQAEIAGFANGRPATTHRLLTQLIRAGADLGKIAPLDANLPPETPVVLLRADLYTPAQRDLVRQYRRFALLDWDSERWCCTLGDSEGSLHQSYVPGQPGTDNSENASWLVELPMAEPPASAIAELAQWLNHTSAASDPTTATFTRLRSEDVDEVIVVNRNVDYATTMLHGVAEVTASTTDARVVRTDDGVGVQLPPRGAALITVQRR